MRPLALLLALSACRAPSADPWADDDDPLTDPPTADSDPTPRPTDAPPVETDVPVPVDPPQCVEVCRVASDCAVVGSALYDDDNWTCDAGTCAWRGCLDDDECAVLGDYACREDGSGTRACVERCRTSEDCTYTGAPAYQDADNFTCAAGVCRWDGCRSDDECAGLGDRACATPFGLAVPTCVERCRTQADCATGAPPGGAYDVDNYVCIDRLCLWKGCLGDAECVTSFADPDYVCR